VGRVCLPHPFFPPVVHTTQFPSLLVVGTFSFFLSSNIIACYPCFFSTLEPAPRSLCSITILLATLAQSCSFIFFFVLPPPFLFHFFSLLPKKGFTCCFFFCVPFFLFSSFHDFLPLPDQPGRPEKFLSSWKLARSLHVSSFASPPEGEPWIIVVGLGTLGAYLCSHCGQCPVTPLFSFIFCLVLHRGNVKPRHSPLPSYHPSHGFFGFDRARILFFPVLFLCN